MKAVRPVLLETLLFLTAVPTLCIGAYAQEPAQADVQTSPIIIGEDHHDISPPLQDMSDVVAESPTTAGPVRVMPLGLPLRQPFIGSGLVKTLYQSSSAQHAV